MEKPVTRAELSEEMTTVRTRFDGVDGRFDGVDGRFDGIDRRLDGIDKRIDTLTASIGETIAQAIVTIDQNLARHVRASEERLRVEIRAFEDPYRDLPGRVTRLEDHVGIKR